ncbi:MAG: hypothetical protein J5I91_06245 [Bacteroidetes bacterium]|nr:hypothetical protein [Bacteroidota bacterium]
MSDRLGYMIKSGAKIILLYCLTAFISCKREPVSDSVIPTLTLNSYQVLPYPTQNKDSIIILKFSYSDADGDIGYPDSDTLSGSDFNIDFFEIINGIPTPYIIPLGNNNTLNFSQRLPYLTPDGKDKSIKGEITFRIPAIPYLGYYPDTVEFKCQLFDRAGNASNQITTPRLRIKH